MNTGTADIRVSLHAAVKALSSVCNGARTWDDSGFNKIDATFGHSLAARPADRWTYKQCTAAYKMLRKYSGQLARMGIQYDAIVLPTEEAFNSVNGARVAPTNIVEFTDNVFVVKFGYDSNIVNAVKAIPSRRWNPVNKSWTVAQSDAQLLRLFMDRFNFKASDAAREALNKLAPSKVEREVIKVLEDIESASIDFSGLGGTLRPFQREGATFAALKERAYIGDDMGLGKTVQAIAFLHAKNAFPAVVVCPALVKLNWARELRKWLPGRSVEVLSSGKPAMYSADITVLNYDILADGLAETWVRGKPVKTVIPSVHTKALLERGLRGIIFDEMHYAKSRTSQRTKACHLLAKNIPYRVGLSGTAIENRPSELITQLDILGRLQEFGGFWGFANRYCAAKQGRFGLDMTGAAHLDELNAKMRGSFYIRRLKKEVLTELPEKEVSSIPIEIDNWDEYEYAETQLIDWIKEQVEKDKDFLDSISDLSDDEQVAAISARKRSKEEAARRAAHLVKINALKQLVAEGKLQSAIDWTKDFLESGQKLVFFASHIKIQKALIKAFPDCAAVTGDMSAEKRQENVDRFQLDPSCRLIVVSLKAGGVGITLTAASNVAFLEFGWTPAIHQQAEDRIHRIGQTNQCTVYYLFGDNTIDEWIVDMLNSKRRVVTATLDGKDAADKLSASIMGDITRRLLSK